MSIATILLTLTTLAQSPDGDKPWQVVTNDAGKFTVEMPSKPTATRTMTRSTQGLRFKIILVVCETKEGDYLTQKIELSQPIAKGIEDTLHDTFRNSLAEDLKGKVTSEKRVSLLGKPGRDYTIQGKPDRDSVVTVRVRQYMQPNAIIQMYVISPPNRNLPDDAGKFLGSFAPGIHKEGTTKKADATEVAMEGRDLPGWGSAVDPGGDCTITPEGTSLTMKVPGTIHDFNADTGDFNSPRIVRDVNGDFTMTVKVDGSFKPGAKGTSKTSVPVNAGGLFVWRDAENYIRLERMAMFRNGKVVSVVLFEEREGGHRGALHNKVIPGGGPVYLRLQRKGNQITAAISDDGQVFEALRPIDTQWPSKLKLGLDAINSCAEPMKVAFSGFSFKSAKP